jgi:hypothetical protein
MNKKELRKIQHPDRFQALSYSVLDWSKKNQSLVSMAVVIAIVVGLFFVGSTYYSKKKLEDRVKQINVIDRLYVEEQKSAQKNQSKLYEELKNLQSKDKKKSKEKKSDNSALVKAKEQEIKNFKGDFSKSTSQFLDYYNSNKEFAEGRRAGLMVVQKYIKEKKYSESEAILSSVLEHKENNKVFLVQARSVYINLLLSVKKYEKIEAQLDTLLLEYPKESMSKVLLFKAQVLLVVGKKEKSLDAVNKILNDYPSSSDAKSAQALKFFIIG